MAPASPPRLGFFVDRSLGRIKVPTQLRAAGIELQTLAEVYGVPADERVTDLEWLELAGSHSWPVLMKDARIRYRSAERAALIEHGVQAFCLTNGNISGAAMADEFLAAMDRIVEVCHTESPCLYAVSRGRLRRLDLS
ncbi:MAG: PIN-like domain-containing protein [Candidatus Nanopelagicales bacterium]